MEKRPNDVVKALTMIWFVYRSHYEGVLSKRVRRLKGATVLEWFQRALKKGGADEIGDVYGFDSLFEEEHEPPKSLAALRALLEETLYVEGDIRLDAHTLRASTDDDEVELAYFFFDETAAKRRDRVAYLLLEEPRLPTRVGKGRYNPPIPIKKLARQKKGSGVGTTYVCLLTFSDSESLPGAAYAIEGVRLPELAPYLRGTTPRDWPFELRLLRAKLGDDDDLDAALRACAAFPMFSVLNEKSTRDALTAADMDALAKDVRFDGKLAKLVIHATPHAVLFSPYVTGSFGHQQWIFFDDLWASANADLATSMLRYATSWDPFGGSK
jgi:hypothetical protein